VEAAFLKEVNTQVSYLYGFARQVNELDFAISLAGEFRGAQDAGWSTTITASEVYQELIDLVGQRRSLSKTGIRFVLMLYCQLAEAGGFYESMKNIMGVIALEPYVLWPFKDLVRIRKEHGRVIGPNANATFRDLATTAKAIGLSRLSALLEEVFRDDIRNGIAHADYVLWDDGLRLPKRNGGYATKLSFKEVEVAVNRAIGFFNIVNESNRASIASFNPPKTIVGKFSANFPQPWTVSADARTGAFKISGSSGGPVVTPEYQRQTEITSRLGGKVMALYRTEPNTTVDLMEQYVNNAGFDPHVAVLNQRTFTDLLADVEKLGLWDTRFSHESGTGVLMASPWGFCWLEDRSHFDAILPAPIVEFEFDSTHEKSTEQSEGPVR
jgi:hypothetical protein